MKSYALVPAELLHAGDILLLDPGLEEVPVNRIAAERGRIRVSVGPNAGLRFERSSRVKVLVGALDTAR